MKTLIEILSEHWESSEEWAWTGIGSRECQTKENEAWMAKFATLMSQKHCKMRSGGAPGPDTYFENGTPNENKEIYLPNETFGKRDLRYAILPKKDLMTWLKAGTIAEKHHKAGKGMPQNVRELMTRNVYQVLGPKLKTPAKFVICDAPRWTLDEQGFVENVSGGTGQAIRIAYENKIPSFVWSIPEHRKQIEEAMVWLEQKLNPIHEEKKEPIKPSQMKLPFK